MPICTIDDEIGTLDRGAAIGMLLDHGVGVELPRGPARHHAGGLEPLLVDVVQRDLDLAQLGEIEDVGQEVLEENRAARADHRDLDHLVEVLGSAT
jgi:hypothetical protein